MNFRAPIALAALLTSSTAVAEVLPDQTGAPYFITAGRDDADNFPLEETTAKVQIAGPIAHVRVRQRYRNQGAAPIEATYVFPGSTRAALFAMTMKVGQRKLRAEIEERGKARRRYDQAKASGKTTSLLEQHRPNVFQMNVANILPGDVIEVDMHYTELLVPEDATYRFVYPTVVGPRYTGEQHAPKREQAPWTASPYLAKGNAVPYRWGIEVDIAGGLSVAKVRSNTHRVRSDFRPSGGVRVTSDEGDGGNRDFVLEYRLGGDRIETGVMLYPGKDEKFFTVMMAPPKKVAPNAIPPREYMFVIDVSGSMGGFPLETARLLAKRMIDSLRPEDRFNILTFAGGSIVLEERSLLALPQNKERAYRFIESLRGGGGTNLLAALKRALAMPREDYMSSTMVAITDGYVSVEKEAFDVVRNGLGKANLFAFGVGSSVNRHLIEGLARAGMGQPFFVLNADQAEPQVAKLTRYLEAPVLTNISVGFSGFDVYDIAPMSVPDLFGARPVVVFGKYRGAARGTIRVTGQNGHGLFDQTLRVEQYAPSDDLVALRYLWARDQIARLSDFGRHTEATKTAVTNLGLKYSLLTSFTSFIAVDDRIRNRTGSSKTVQQPLPLPKGVGNGAVGSKGVLKSLGATKGGGALKDVLQGRRGGAIVNGFSGVRGSELGDAGGIGGLGSRGMGAGGGGQSLRASGYGKGRARAGAIDRNVAVKKGAPLIMGSLDKSQISRVMRRHRKQIAAVYERSLKANPKLHGRFVLRFTITADGSVKDVKVLGNIKDARFVAGLKRAIAKMRFPKPAGGGVVIVSYPMVFASK